MSRAAAIIGCGALGGVFAGLLAGSGVDVTAVVRTEQQRRDLTENGLRLLEYGKEKKVCLQACTELPLGQRFDLVLVLVKAYDTAAAAKHLSGRVAPGTAVLTLQNGLGNAEALAARLKPEQVLAGITTFGALRESATTVRLTGRGECVIGPWQQGIEAAESAAAASADLLASNGIPCTVAPNVQPMLWKKLSVSAVINPLTAILRVPNGELLNRPELNALIAVVIEEVWRVAARHSVPLPTPPELVEEVCRVCRGTASNRSSMLRDIEEERRTEIDSINGAVVQLGMERGTLAPANLAMASVVRALSGRNI
jgi:2-dehydropantoate 2-reductase